MKRFYILIFATLITIHVFAQNNLLETLTSEFKKAIPKGFAIEESGTDKGNLYLVFKKSSQEIITVNLQKEHDIEFEDVDSFEHNNYQMTFYYAGFKKSAALVVFLNNTSKYLVLGYNKPYMGDEIVKKDELITIIDRIDLKCIK